MLESVSGGREGCGCVLAGYGATYGYKGLCACVAAGGGGGDDITCVCVIAGAGGD